jgi:chromosomal replication initiation ATPase DnaA
MTLHEYTHELIDEIIKIANIDSLTKHKIIRRVHNLKTYKELKLKNLSVKKLQKPRRPVAQIPFHTLPAKIQQVMLIACSKYDITIQEFCSNRKTDDIVDTQRHVIFYLHKYLGYSSKKVGMFFMKDHSTVLHACRVHFDRLEVERIYNSLYQSIKREANEVIFEASPQPTPE